MRRSLGRLARMDYGELSWRAGAASRRGWDRMRAVVRQPRWDRRRLASSIARTGDLEEVRRALDEQRWLHAHQRLSQHFAAGNPHCPLRPAAREPFVASVLNLFPGAPVDAASRADRIVGGEYDVLGYRGLRFASIESARDGSDTLPDWHFDPVHGRRAPRRFWTTIDYLNPRYGDHKIIWELNRHQHWLVLGRAYWLTNDRRYRDRFQQEFASWLAANPPLTGVNWASMLELSLRTISWIWALNFFVRDPGAAGVAAGDEDPWTVDLLLAIERQLTQVERNLSRYFSPNTHLLGEALALYVAGRALPELAGSARWTQMGRQVLAAEIDRQIAADGGHAERSAHYHRYTLDFYILALVVARVTGDPVASTFETTVARLGRAARLFADDNGRLPHLGDDDGGRLFPIVTRDCDDIRDTLEMAAALVDCPELAVGGERSEEALWMLGATSAFLENSKSQIPESKFPSAALPDTGYYISRSAAGHHLVIDAGPHGYQNGGHAHADALSLTLTIGGTPLLVDPGTCCYTTSAPLRDRFRSSALHNTLVLDGRSQSIPSGPFHWSTVADGAVECWRVNEHFDYFCGSHNGYRPAVHHRHVLVRHGDLLVVADFVDASGTHSAAVHWHVHPAWRVDALGQRLSFVRPDGPCAMTFATPGGVIECLRGDSEAGLGLYSPVYGQLAELTTVRITETAAAPFWMAGAFDLSGASAIDGVEWVPSGSSPGAAVLRIRRSRSIDYVLFTTSPRAAEGGGRIGAGEIRRAGDLETDARMLFYREDRGRLVSFAVVDGSLVRCSAGRIYLSLTEPAPDVHVDVEPCAA